jgi:hypothetical protein
MCEEGETATGRSLFVLGASEALRGLIYSIRGQSSGVVLWAVSVQNWVRWFASSLVRSSECSRNKGA